MDVSNMKYPSESDEVAMSRYNSLLCYVNNMILLTQTQTENVFEQLTKFLLKTMLMAGNKRYADKNKESDKVRLSTLVEVSL